MPEYSANQANQPIPASDAELARQIEGMSTIVLALSAVHMSGSLDIIRSGPKPMPPAFNGDTEGSLTEEETARLRARALEIVKAWRDAGHPEPYRPNEDELHEMMKYMLGIELPREHVPMIREDMALDSVDAREFQWTRQVREEDKQRSPVIIIGAGMSGMLIGLRLKQAGIPFTILERNQGVGGTWFENRYPGLRVDVPSHSYSFSFIQDHRWSHLYSYQPDLLDYFEKCRDRFGISDHIRYGTEVKGADWNEAQQRWDIAVRNNDGSDEVVEAKSLVSACGFFNKTHTPDFEGRDIFKGEQLHSGRWRDDVALKGKRVAVIGNAATSLQMVPPIAEIASQLTIFQRNASWTSINPEYDRSIREEEQWAIEHLPYYAGWMRAAVFNWTLDMTPHHMIVDPDWPQDGRSVSQANEMVRQRQTAVYEQWLGHRPDLLEKLLPDYPPMVKRPTIGHGNFFEAVLRDNVEVVSDSIVRLTESGIVDETGCEREFDVIIYATGYKVQEYISPMVIRGRGGIEINEFWKDRPGGYLGMIVPNFPNFYMMYGPGTNLGYNGNLIFNSELQARYIAYCVRLLVESGRDALEVREKIFQDYMDRTEEMLKQFVWSTEFGTSYFRNASGHVTTNSPWSLLEMWTWSKEPDPADFSEVEELAEV
ncbi:MAG: NAD(P)/FAD-dependent oxidoreductase [Novosphingobium sp.]|nr:NAD(P)/FAD-dependent oxidoreductase [Novosphingobium sp.]